MKAAAKGYFLQGVNIIPVKGKQPLIQWEKWQTEKQAEADFNGQPWDKADGFALIGGSRLDNGLHICAVDFDVKNLPSEAIGKGRKILGSFLTTQIEETPSGGQHWIYLSHTKSKAISAYHIQCALELLGENKLIIMAPSKNYKRLNDNTPTETENLETLFSEILQKAGITNLKASDYWFDKRDLPKPYDGQDPQCIKLLLQRGLSEGVRNETAIRLSSYLLNFRQLSQDEVWQKLLKWNRKNRPTMEESELRTIMQSAIRGKYVYGCTDPILKEHCNRENCIFGKKEKTVSKATIITPFFELSDGRLAEQGFDGKEVYFLIYDPKDGSIQKQLELEMEGTAFKPIMNDEVTLRLTLLPSLAAEYENDQKLLDEIIAFLNKWHEAPTQRDRKLTLSTLC